MVLTTNRGIIEIAMDAAKTPCAIASFNHLAGKQFFNGSTCHRLVDDGIWVLQCGDPTGTGTGGPGYAYLEENLPPRPGVTTRVECTDSDPTHVGAGRAPLPEGSCPPGTQATVTTMWMGASPAAVPDVTYRRGSVAVATTADPGSSGSQFFFSYRDNVLPASYTQLGTVTKGMDVVDAVAKGGLRPDNGEHDGRPKLDLVLNAVTVTYGG
jgi:peptidyl-prolyl cis-trans isomerase B (cyclophilin B)